MENVVVKEKNKKLEKQKENQIQMNPEVATLFHMSYPGIWII